MSATVWEPVIGLEVHVQLATRTKLFAPDPIQPGAPPNTTVSEVSLGLPGTLPTINRRAVELAVLAGVALGCEVQTTSEFARKNYFYPDLPRGYQISQFDKPVCLGGEVTFDLDGEEIVCPLTRIHLEDDAGKSIHEGNTPWSRIDFNRAGVPLIEVVSEPALRSPAEAAAFLRALHEIVVCLGVGHGNLEAGQFRCDANISLRPQGQIALGVRAEIKNLNSFKFVQAALEHEIARQSAILDAGGEVVQETRLYDSDAGRTISMRRKEGADDYRYFPDPDLPVLRIAPEMIASIRDGLPELPRARRQRFVGALGLSATDAEILTSFGGLADLFEATVGHLPSTENVRTLTHLLTGDVLRLCNARDSTVGELALPADALALLAVHVDGGTITRNAVAPLLNAVVDDVDVQLDVLIDRLGLKAVSDDAAIEVALSAMLDAADAETLKRYRAGQKKLFGYFMGAAMKALKGKGDPTVVRAVLRRLLDAT